MTATHSDLATPARFECAERQRLYPALVQRQRIKVPAAVVDTECWHRIALAFENCTPLMQMLAGPGYPVVWSEVATALDQAEQTRSNACSQNPNDLPLAKRRDAVVAIVAQVRPIARLYIAVMNELRPTPALIKAA